MDIRQLRYFVSIVESGSLGKAAEMLYVAQPSLSQQMSKLESELGVAVLIRSPQGVKPTPSGEALYRHARTVLHQMQQLRQEVVEGVGAESGTVAIGLPTTMSAVLAMSILQRVRERFPRIRLQLIESMSGYLTELLVNGRVDLAILFRESNTAGISAIPLFDEELYVMGEIDGLPERSRTCPLAALGGLPLIAPGEANGLRRLLERTFGREQVQLNIVADVDSLPTLLAAAKSGEAATILPASAVASQVPKDRPKMRRIINPVIERPASLCWPSWLPVSSASLAVRRIVADLVAELGGRGDWAGISLRASASEV